MMEKALFGYNSVCHQFMDMAPAQGQTKRNILFFLTNLKRLDSQQHSLRVFHELLKVLQPLCSYSPVNNSVIAGHCDSHHVGHRGAAISSNHNLLLCPADSQDARLWWVDDGRELVDAKHAQVGHSDGASLVFVWR